MSATIKLKTGVTARWGMFTVTGDVYLLQTGKVDRKADIIEIKDKDGCVAGVAATNRVTEIAFTAQIPDPSIEPDFLDVVTVDETPYYFISSSDSLKAGEFGSRDFTLRRYEDNNLPPKPVTP